MANDIKTNDSNGATLMLGYQADSITLFGEKTVKPPSVFSLRHRMRMDEISVCRQVVPPREEDRAIAGSHPT